jgi:6-pyruvoyltetrahydropterin/6-carboxytetrahydropterin synthase
MVVDFAVLKDAWAPLHEALDHRLLNEVSGLDNPTAEMLACWISQRLELPALAAVEVYETESTGVRWQA